MNPSLKNTMKTFRAGSLIFLIFCTVSCGMQLVLESPKSIFYEEETVLLNLKIFNDSSQTESYIIEFLQPREKNWMYIGNLHKLNIEGIPEMANFTNHMPPEPKPHSPQTNKNYKPIFLNPGETYSIQIPFFYEYYPVKLPSTFKVNLCWLDKNSNPVVFTVFPTKGTKKGSNLIINGDFSEGQGNIPYGWKILDDRTYWDSSQKFLKYSVDRKTAESEGYWAYSVFHEISSPSQYILSVRTKTSGPIIIIFVEGWAIVGDRRRRIERNECFYHQPANQTWQTQLRNVKFTNPEVKWMRLKLYVYGSPGDVWFSDISLIRK
ncbi:MAG: hypothetical protein NC906_05870 [Candidatus Omnitrophica bacterium]|nr:hypothetical protein [Candidatus Omnitrophota bacterium]